MRSHAGRGQPPPGRSRHPHRHGHDCGRDDYPCTIVDQERDRHPHPEMHQTRKGNQWFFEMKAHIGVDSKEGIVHSVCSTAASVADKHMLADLLHGHERKVWGDGAYQGQGEAIRQPHRMPRT